MNIGFIGLGAMGRPMALNLRQAGFKLWVYARRQESVQPLADAGAQVVASLAELLPQVDVLITMVSDTPDVTELLLGEGGAVVHGRPGLVVVDMSTIAPAGARQCAQALAQRQIDFLDAPVSGGVVGAQSGELTIMVGGKADVLARVQPVLEVMGRRITHMGEVGAGQVAKACNQILVAQSLVAVSEALTFAQRQGVEVSRVREGLLGGFAASRVLEHHGQKILQQAYEPGFKAELHAKDMQIALAEAEQLGLALPGAEHASQLIAQLVAAGEGALDSCAIAKLVGWRGAHGES